MYREVNISIRSFTNYSSSQVITHLHSYTQPQILPPIVTFLLLGFRVTPGNVWTTLISLLSLYSFLPFPYISLISSTLHSLSYSHFSGGTGDVREGTLPDEFHVDPEAKVLAATTLLRLVTLRQELWYLVIWGWWERRWNECKCGRLLVREEVVGGG